MTDTNQKEKSTDKSKVFRLLREEAASQDKFSNRTHNRVAEAIFHFMEGNEEAGVTIGLEGEWGSGKSTVLKILKNKLDSNKYCYFHFDAWAHEGDPLRRRIRYYNFCHLEQYVPKWN
ncbi:MAG: P-loop NTPase fold protein [Alphaproteobacteria bacterium]|nr:P-loop NTPase fold protein [Alphaproteobacteria bacterium]